MRTFYSSEINEADLFVDAIYQGGRRGTAGDDPLPHLIGVSCGGGFRYRGSLDRLELVALTSSKRDPDWPDELDRETGIYTYFGDNKVPGRDLHGTLRSGNRLLARVFEDSQGGPDGRLKVPPILAFASSDQGRDVIFLGLAVPGTTSGRPQEDLVAVWRTRNGQRFQNYRSRFTILQTNCVSRKWISSIVERRPDSKAAPEAWLNWVETGRITPLIAPRTIQHRKRSEQLPNEDIECEMLRVIHGFFEKNPYGFEHCATEIAKMMLPSITSIDLTRRSRDGGRDAIGEYRIGSGPGSILVDFALEAKCYSSNHSIGVREMSRLISRLRHRQFGLLVTTSYVDEQAYKEIKEDQHPIIVIAAIDIVRLLKEHGYSTVDDVRAWLTRAYSSYL